MKLQDVHGFFEHVARRFSHPLTVLITGGAAAIVFGVSRATEDIDFEVAIAVPPSKSQEAWIELERVLNEVQQRTGIAPEFSEDIDRWSSIALPFKKSKRVWKLGRIDIRVLDPLLWSVGKLARYLSTDESDVATVFKKLKPPALSVARLWGQALGRSPASSAQTLFRNHVRSFLDKYAASIWGKTIAPDRLFDIFLRAAAK